MPDLPSTAQIVYTGKVTAAHPLDVICCVKRYVSDSEVCQARVITVLSFELVSASISASRSNIRQSSTLTTTPAVNKVEYVCVLVS